MTPYSKKITKSLLKEPKYYFYDLQRVRGDEGVKLENLVALSLKKQIDFLGDTIGKYGQLYFLRTRDAKELDFCIMWENRSEASSLIEVKLSDSNLSANFSFFKKFIKNAKCIQLVKNLEKEKHYPSGESVLPALSWLTEMKL